LVVNPKDRLDAEAALKHPWILERDTLSDDMPRIDSLAKIHDNLSNYRHTSELKKLALTVIAHRSTQNDIIKLRSVFQKYDTEHDGVLSYEEFQAALQTMNYPEETLEEIFDSIDVNHNGHIMWTEVSI
jgi:calcium-dependent protein kinase